MTLSPEDMEDVPNAEDDMTAIEDVLEIEYARKDIEDYREKLIAGSYTDMFLKASFLVEKRKVTAYYKTAGYKSILRCRTDFSKLVKHFRVFDGKDGRSRAHVFPGGWLPCYA